eukprot:1438626-Prymnesium_polylepis.2
MPPPPPPLWPQHGQCARCSIRSIRFDLRLVAFEVRSLSCTFEPRALVSAQARLPGLTHPLSPPWPAPNRSLVLQHPAPSSLLRLHSPLLARASSSQAACSRR